MLLVNHASTASIGDDASSPSANVRVQWAPLTEDSSGRTMSIADLLNPLKSNTSPPRLLLELVATQDIRQGEEILLDYGPRWQQAWQAHANQWKQSEKTMDKSYAPSYVYEDAIQALRVQAELQKFAYPSNIFTSCFYKYRRRPSSLATNDDKTSTTAVPWEMERGMFALENLRPYNVLSRKQQTNGTGKTKKTTTTFTVQLLNRYGIPKSAPHRIPRGEHVIISNLPRHAIRFSDKIYTSDQHLEWAFRHKIGVPEGLYPPEWLDGLTKEAA